jgi:hypothetical protein
VAAVAFCGEIKLISRILREGAHEVLDCLLEIRSSTVQAVSGVGYVPQETGPAWQELFGKGMTSLVFASMYAEICIEYERQTSTGSSIKSMLLTFGHEYGLLYTFMFESTPQGLNSWNSPIIEKDPGPPLIHVVKGAVAGFPFLVSKNHQKMCSLGPTSSKPE